MNIKNFNPKQRFSDRVHDYVKYRPSYPVEIISILKEIYGIGKDQRIAEIGSGTGILTKIFLEQGYPITAIEPNQQMRTYAENTLSHYPNFQSINGSAENTTLPDHSIDLIVVAQAFHWFDVETTVPEFHRILKENGIICLIWNERKIPDSGFQKEYEDAIIRYCVDYKKVNHKNFSSTRLREIFSGKHTDEYYLDNEQNPDLTSLIGRLKSSSYCPKENDKNYVPLYEAVRSLFDRYQKNGKVKIEYDCSVYRIVN